MDAKLNLSITDRDDFAFPDHAVEYTDSKFLADPCLVYAAHVLKTPVTDADMMRVEKVGGIKQDQVHEEYRVVEKRRS
ncbi:hypothetical protein GCM10009109_14510 [Marinobacterium sediminicola]